VALAEQPDMALIALTHTLTAQLFYSYAEAGCLEVRPTVTPLGSHADGIEDTPLAARASEQHEAWAERMPRDVADLWAFIVGLDGRSGLRCWRIARPAPSTRCVCRGTASPGRCKRRTGWRRAGAGRGEGLDADGGQLPWPRHQGAYRGGRDRRRVRGCRLPYRGHEEAGHGASRRAASGRDRLASRDLRTPEPEAEQPAPVEAENNGTVEQPSEAEAPDTGAQDGEASYAVAAE
jgi:ParB family chromosome partitioning protein